MGMTTDTEQLVIKNKVQVLVQIQHGDSRCSGARNRVLIRGHRLSRKSRGQLGPHLARPCVRPWREVITGSVRGGSVGSPSSPGPLDPLAAALDAHTHPAGGVGSPPPQPVGNGANRKFYLNV